MKDIYRSISLDDGRINVTETDGIYTVTKITSQKEVQNMAMMESHLKSVGHINLGSSEYRISIPQIINWDDASETLVLEPKEGDNLEKRLTDVSPTRQNDILLIQKFFGWMQSSGTFWRAAAPRHIVINDSNREITLLDFERPVVIKAGGFDNLEFQKRIRGLVHEEFCAFLFDDDQQKIFPEIWDYDKSETIETGSIFGKRVNLLMQYYFGSLGKSVSTEKLMFVYKLMSSVVTPFYIDETPFYPILVLDKIARDPKEYVRIVTKLVTIDRKDWKQFLENEN